MLAFALGPGIRVNAIAPGVILPAGEFDEAYMQKRQEKTPLKQLATPDDIANAALHLLTTPYLTGQVLYVDGGEHVL